MEFEDEKDQDMGRSYSGCCGERCINFFGNVSLNKLKVFVVCNSLYKFIAKKPILW